MTCDDIKLLQRELKKSLEILERERLYTAAFIILFKLLVAKIDYKLCLRGIIVRNHKHRKEQLEYFHKFKELKRCYVKLYRRYKGAYRKIVSKEEYFYYKKFIEKCLE